MRIAIGSDHHGVQLKARLVTNLREEGHVVTDVGTDTVEPPVDYPDIAAAVARQITDNQADRGILICGSGVGMSIVANKFPQVRAVACTDLRGATMSRRHNDTNIVCLSDEYVSLDDNLAIVNTWMSTDFDGGRHQRRIDKISQLECP